MFAVNEGGIRVLRTTRAMSELAQHLADSMKHVAMWARNETFDKDGISVATESIGPSDPRYAEAALRELRGAGLEGIITDEARAEAWWQLQALPENADIRRLINLLGGMSDEDVVALASDIRAAREMVAKAQRALREAEAEEARVDADAVDAIRSQLGK